MNVGIGAAPGSGDHVHVTGMVRVGIMGTVFGMFVGMNGATC